MASNYNKRLHLALKRHLEIFADLKSNQLRDHLLEKIHGCPACDCKTKSLLFSKDFFPHYKCTQCSLVYVNPRLTTLQTHNFYNSEANEIYNEKKFYGDSTLDNEFNERNFQIIQKLFPKSSKRYRLLEIGPGNGYFTRRALEHGFDVSCIELNLGLAVELRKSGAFVYSNDLVDLSLPTDYFDVIFMRDVIEHIPSPNIFIKELVRIMKPSGYLLLDTHNIFSIVNLLTGPFHTVIFPFEHPLHWSPRSLIRLCNSHQLHLRHFQYDHGNQGLLDILSYRTYPSFTYILPPPKKWTTSIIVRPLLYFSLLFRLHKLDRLIMSFISVLCRRGSTMQLLFQK